MDSDVGPNLSTADLNPSQPGAVCQLPSTKDIHVQRKKAASTSVLATPLFSRTPPPGPVSSERMPLPRPPRPYRSILAPRVQPAPIETTASFTSLGSKARIAREVAPNVSIFIPDAPNAGPATMPQLVPDAGPSEDLGASGMASTRNTDEFWGAAPQEHVSEK